MTERCEISLLISSLLNVPYSGVADTSQHTFSFFPPLLSLLPSRWQRGKQNVEKAPKGGEIAHVYNRTHAWVIARLSNTDCDDRWSDRLQLILSPWMRSLVLQHPSMNFRCDVWAMPPHGVGWAACPWIGAENSPDTDIGLTWWSFLLSWKDSTPTSFPSIFCPFFLICVIHSISTGFSTGLFFF